ncbi:hypothetical protein DOY81_007613, partial [Sarcophaga bullata]
VYQTTNSSFLMCSSKYIHKLVKCFIIFMVLPKIKADYSASVVGLENLIKLEKDYIQAVEKYISDVIKTQQEIKSFLSEVELHHEQIKKNPEKYYGQPANAYQMIRRMVVDWKHYEELITMSPEYMVYNLTINYFNTKYRPPEEEDLLGAAAALKRLQFIYALETEDLAQDNILEENFSEKMKAHDAFVLARSLFERKEYSYASEWFLQALQLLNNEDAEYMKANELVLKYPFITHNEVLHHLSLALFHAGNYGINFVNLDLIFLPLSDPLADNYKMAKMVNQELLFADPTNAEALNNKEFFENTVIAERRLRHVQPKPKKSRLQELYRQVCNGELTQTAKELRNLRCRYAHNNVGFYMIGPLKMEQLNLDPFVAVYYEAINDHEIEQIIAATEQRVEKSKVGAYKTSIYSELRTSKHAWLWNESYLENLRQRIEDITALSTASEEPLQVVNYGMGGHYAPHYDFAPFPEHEYGDKGNRLLTALFYMNDVEMGGSTAFPFLRVLVPPIKRSLLVWYNMHNSTEVDYRTKHAGCPVLKGTKWIATKWLHIAKQELKYPCGLQPIGDKYKHYNYIY